MAEQHEQEPDKKPVQSMEVIPAASDVQSKEAEKSSDGAKPPRLYIPACGVLCDAFWWAGSKTK
jgi:hypothetical protein